MSSLRDVEASFRVLTMGEADKVVFEGVPHERQHIYRTLVRNNVRGTIRRATPHTIRIVGDEAFDGVVDRFLAEHPVQTRLTRDIAGEFCEWLMAQPSTSLPAPAFAELCHFEALEIEVTMAEVTPHIPGGLGVGARIQMDASARLAIYRHPVHRVTRATTAMPAMLAQPTVLVCFQDRDAMAVEPISAALGKVLLASVQAPVVDVIDAVVAEGALAGIGIDPRRLRSELVGLHRRGAIAGFVV